jgi:hypothetical protein
MTRAKMRLLQFVLVTAVCGGVLLGSEQAIRSTTGSLVSQASAVIGRPLTPLSYAGVARRTTRRAVAVGVAVGAAAPVVVVPAPVVVAPSCVQMVDAYGRVYTRCP